MEDPEFIERLRRRERDAMDLLVTRHHADVYRFLRHLTRHSQEAEDLAQSTLIRVLDRIDTYAGKASLRSWLLGVAYREFTGWRRRRLWLPLLGDRPDKNSPYDDLAEAEALLAAIGRLPDALKATFLMHHVEEVPIAEIALTFAIPEGTVKSRLHAARTRLRTILREEEAYVPEAC